MKTVITGLQPTGVITLGNYIGAIKPMVKNQDADTKNLLFVADLHSITIPQDPAELRAKIKELIALYLACGIDPTKNLIYVQSDIEYIPCISWLLECNTYYGELSRMTQFKDKSLKNQNFTTGLLTYPVLMAADILAVDSHFVPVGIDQKQHVEIARDIAIRFNKKYGETFVVPEPVIKKVGAKIMDLVTPDKKMSKSAENPKGVIRLLDDEATIRKKIMSATTDSEMEVKYNPETKAGVSNLMVIYSDLAGLTITEVEDKFKGANYGTFKREVADVVVSELTKIQSRFYEFLQDKNIDKMLDDNAAIIREMCKNKYDKMKQAMGLKR